MKTLELRVISILQEVVQRYEGLKAFAMRKKHGKYFKAQVSTRSVTPSCSSQSPTKLLKNKDFQVKSHPVSAKKNLQIEGYGNWTIFPKFPGQHEAQTGLGTTDLLHP